MPFGTGLPDSTGCRVISTAYLFTSAGAVYNFVTLSFDAGFDIAALGTDDCQDFSTSSKQRLGTVSG